MIPVPFELEHAIDHVLQHLGTSDETILGDVPYQDHGYGSGLGEPHQFGRALTYLAHTPGTGVQYGGVQRLHAIDHHQRRLQCFDMLEDVLCVRFGEHGTLAPLFFTTLLQAIGTHLNLMLALFTGNIQCAKSGIAQRRLQ